MNHACTRYKPPCPDADKRPCLIVRSIMLYCNALCLLAMALQRKMFVLFCCFWWSRRCRQFQNSIYVYILVIKKRIGAPFLKERRARKQWNFVPLFDHCLSHRQYQDLIIYKKKKILCKEGYLMQFSRCDMFICTLSSSTLSRTFRPTTRERFVYTF